MIDLPDPPRSKADGLVLAHRYHDISCGHRVHGHESKCAHLHGHNYRIHFDVGCPGLDKVGRVMDFSVIKARLCAWLEARWDHRMLIGLADPMLEALRNLDPDGVVAVPFNPTAENMALHLLNVVGPKLLEGSNCWLVSVTVEETRKCSASARR